MTEVVNQENVQNNTTKVAELFDFDSVCPNGTPEERALKLKDMGNDFYRQHRYTNAIRYYEASLDIDSSSPVVLHNLACCNYQNGNWGSCIDLATRALELDATYVKCYYRRANAYYAIREFEKAIEDYSYVCRINPSKTAKRKLQEAKDSHIAEKRLEALRASSKKLVDSLDVTSLTYPANALKLTGPVDAVPSEELIRNMISFIREDGNNRFHTSLVLRLVFLAHKIMRKEPNVVRSTTKFVDDQKLIIVGDVHGQISDLFLLFDKYGLPGVDSKYMWVFNGDYVDRGNYSVEICSILFALKAYDAHHNSDCPQLTLLRGNHEAQETNSIFGFHRECCTPEPHGYASSQLFMAFTECFESLPIAALINNRIYCTHGGLFSQSNVNLGSIDIFDRFQQPNSGHLVSALWSDPAEDDVLEGRHPSQRGTAFVFGWNVWYKWAKLNGITHMFRGHQFFPEGYKLHWAPQAEEHKKYLYTVFSAANYVNAENNGSVAICSFPVDTTSADNLTADDIKVNFETWKPADAAVFHPTVERSVMNAGVSEMPTQEMLQALIQQYLGK